MKWLLVLLLAGVIFGGAAFFSYDLFVKPEQTIRAEKSGEIPVEPLPDISLPEFQAAAVLRQDGKLGPCRDALMAFLQRFPNTVHSDEARDLLGDVNMQILLSNYPSPEKQEYIVKRGDVLARVANKTKTTPELIMRTNNLNGNMLHVGQRLLISRPDFSLFIQRKPQTIVLMNHGAFFKRYRIRTVKVPANSASRINTRVAETEAWKNGKRVGAGTREFLASTHRIRLAAPGYTIFADPPTSDTPPTPGGLGLAASDVDELSGLVNGKTAVTITD